MLDHAAAIPQDLCQHPGSVFTITRPTRGTHLAEGDAYIDSEVQKLACRQPTLTKRDSTMKNYRRILNASLPAILIISLQMILGSNAFAQGPIFTGDAANLSNIIREALKLMAIALFCLGAVGVAWSIYNKMTGKEWGNQAFGSILAFAFGTIVAVFWQIAQGRAVSVDTNF